MYALEYVLCIGLTVYIEIAHRYCGTPKKPSTLPTHTYIVLNIIRICTLYGIISLLNGTSVLVGNDRIYRSSSICVVLTGITFYWYKTVYRKKGVPKNYTLYFEYAYDMMYRFITLYRTSILIITKFAYYFSRRRSRFYYVILFTHSVCLTVSIVIQVIH